VPGEVFLACEIGVLNYILVDKNIIYTQRFLPVHDRLYFRHCRYFLTCMCHKNQIVALAENYCNTKKLIEHWYDLYNLVTLILKKLKAAFIEKLVLKMIWYVCWSILLLLKSSFPCDIQDANFYMFWRALITYTLSLSICTCRRIIKHRDRVRTTVIKVLLQLDKQVYLE